TSLAACRFEKLVPGAELDSGPALRRSTRLLDRVDGFPARVRDRFDTTFGEELVDRPRGVMREEPGAGVLEQELGSLGRVLLVRPDDPGRAALDPACAVEAPDRGTAVVDHAAVVVGHRPRLLVERRPGKRDAVVADAPEDDPAR